MDKASISITLRIDTYVTPLHQIIVSKLSRIRNAMPSSWPDKMQSMLCTMHSNSAACAILKTICRGV